MSLSENKLIEITLRRSAIAITPNQRINLKGLGLRKRQTSVVRPDSASIRGMIQKVIHLVQVRGVKKEEVSPVQTSPSSLGIEILSSSPSPEGKKEIQKKSRKSTVTPSAERKKKTSKRKEEK